MFTCIFMQIPFFESFYEFLFNQYKWVSILLNLNEIFNNMKMNI